MHSKQGFKNIFVTAKKQHLGTFCINIFENLATTQSLLQYNLLSMFPMMQMLPVVSSQKLDLYLNLNGLVIYKLYSL